jgi:replicative DNA helicase
MTFEKIPPQALDVERTVLGSMLIDANAVNTAVSILTYQCFYSTQNQRVFTAMMALYEKNQPIDVLTLKDELAGRKWLESVGAEPYISELSSSVATSANIEHHCKILKDKLILRQMIAEGSTMVQDAFECDGDAGKTLETAQDRVYRINSQGSGKETHISRPISEALTEISSRKHGEISGISTGFKWLDAKTAGFQPGDMVLVAGRPGSGKTALECAIMLRQAKMGYPVLGFSMEMGDRSLSKRLICLEAKVDMMSMQLSILDAEEHARIKLAASTISALPIYIDDSRFLTMSRMRGKIRKMIADYGIRIAYIDHWHLIDKDAEMKYLRGHEIITAISRKVKVMAGDFNIPIVPLAQLSRESDRHNLKSHRPNLSDLRDAGEQDADLVIMTHREEFYPPIFKSTKTKTAEEQEAEWKEKYVGKAEVIISKHRNGPTGSNIFGFEKHFARFYDPKEEESTQYDF